MTCLKNTCNGMNVQVDVQNKGDEAEGSEENRIVDSLMQFLYSWDKDART